MAATRLTLEEVKASLQTKIENFNYAGLRSVLVEMELGEEKLQFHHASEEAVVELIGLFPNEHRRIIQNNLSDFEPLLIQFKNNIQKSESDYFANIKKVPKEELEFISALRADHNWVIYFHFAIEKYFYYFPKLSLEQYGSTLRFMKDSYLKCEIMSREKETVEEKADSKTLKSPEKKRRRMGLFADSPPPSPNKENEGDSLISSPPKRQRQPGFGKKIVF